MARPDRVLLLILAMGAAYPMVVNASHDVPHKSAGIRVGLVRAHDPCAVPNAVHDQVVVFSSACAPAVPFSAYTFGPRGQGKVQVRRVGDGIQMRFVLTDVLTVGDDPADNVTFSGRAALRLTDHGCSSAPSCTVETGLSMDIPCVNGRCFASQVYPDLFLPVGLEASAEVLQVDVLDGSDNRFATQGFLLN
jgi:hypothetical protein